jgi:hypothetical protein
VSRDLNLHRETEEPTYRARVLALLLAEGAVAALMPVALWRWG